MCSTWLSNRLPDPLEGCTESDNLNGITPVDIPLQQHLRIKHYYGTSPNAVKTQIWISMTVYLLIAILHKQLGLPGGLNRTLQILSVHPFEKTPLNELLAENEPRTLGDSDHNQLTLWDL